MHGGGDRRDALTEIGETAGGFIVLSAIIRGKQHVAPAWILRSFPETLHNLPEASRVWRTVVGDLNPNPATTHDARQASVTHVGA